METLDYNVLEQLNKEWTEFLDSIPRDSGNSVAEANRRFVSRRNIWLQRMKKKYNVTLEQLKHHYVHD